MMIKKICDKFSSPKGVAFGTFPNAKLGLRDLDIASSGTKCC